MSKLKAPLLGFKAHGSIGKKITYANTLQGIVAKSIPTHADAQTLAQMYQRWRFIDARYYWRSLSQAQRDAYETSARPYHMTGWAYFLRWYLTNLPDQVLWLPLDEIGGSRASDISGKDNHGTLYGTSPATGKIDGARFFDGTDDRIIVDHAPTLNMSAAFTICAFVYGTLPTDGEYWYIATKGSWTTGTYGLEKYFNTDFGNFFLFDLVPNGVFGTTPLNDGQWHHVCGVYDGSKIYFYTDGELDNDVAVAGTLSSNAQDFWVGAYPAPTYWWKGRLDDLRLYTRALSPEHIKYIATQEFYPIPSS